MLVASLKRRHMGSLIPRVKTVTSAMRPTSVLPIKRLLCCCAANSLQVFCPSLLEAHLMTDTLSTPVEYQSPFFLF